MENIGSTISILGNNNDYSLDLTWKDLFDSVTQYIQNREYDHLQKALLQTKLLNDLMRQYQKSPTDTDLQYIYDLLPSLYNFIFAYPFLHFNTQSFAAITFLDITCLLRRFKIPKGIHLSVEKAIFFLQSIFFPKTRLGPFVFTTGKYENFLTVSRMISFFLSEEDSDFLLKKYGDRFIDSTYTNQRSILLFLHFYPNDRASFFKVVDRLISLFQSAQCLVVTTAVIDYFCKCLLFPYTPTYYDWKPFIKPLFHTLFVSIDPKITILNHTFSMAQQLSVADSCPFFSRNDYIRIFASFISVLLTEFDCEQGEKVSQVVLEVLQQFVNFFLPSITPKSKATAQASISFIKALFSQFHSRCMAYTIYEKEQPEIVSKSRISDETKNKFVVIILPLLKAALFNGTSKTASIVAKLFHPLLFFAYDIVFKRLFPFVVDNMIDPELSNRSTTCRLIVSSWIYTSLLEEHLEDSIMYIPKIIEYSLKRIEIIPHQAEKQFFISLKILSEISQYTPVPSQEEIDKMPIKKRAVCNALLNALNVIVDRFFKLFFTPRIESQEQAGQPSTGHLHELEIMSLSGSSVVSFFSSFHDSHIVALLPKYVNYCKEHESNVNLTRTQLIFFSEITKSKPELLAAHLSPIFENFYFNSETLSKRQYWTFMLISTLTTTTTFSSKIPVYMEIIKKNIDDFEEVEDDSMQGKILCWLISRAFESTISMIITNFSSDDQKWGQGYEASDIVINLFYLNRKFVSQTLSSLFEVVQTLTNKFCTFPLQKQTVIISILEVFSNLLIYYQTKVRPKFDSPELKDVINKIESSVLAFIQEYFAQSKSYNTTLLLFKYLKTLFHNPKRVAIPIASIYSYLFPRYMIFNTLQFDYHNLRTIYSFEYKSQYKPLFDLIFDYTYSEFQSIGTGATNCLRKVILPSNDVRSFLDKNIQLLIEENKTEYQLKGAIRNLNSVGMDYFIENPDMLPQLFLNTITMKYKVEWQLDISIMILLGMFETMSFFVILKDDEPWKPILNGLSKIHKTLDDRIYYHLLKRLVLLKLTPSIELMSIMVNSVLNPNDIHRNIFISSLSNLFFLMKPIAPRSTYKSIDEFKQKHGGKTPYIDRPYPNGVTPSQYVFYDGPSVFSQTTIDKYGHALQYLKDNLINNAQTFLENFLSINSNDHLAKPLYKFESFWKGIGQLFRLDIINQIKGTVLKKLEDLSLSANLVLCDIVFGLLESTKHWPENETKQAIDEFFKPAMTLILKPQYEKKTQSCINSFLSYLFKNFDYQRNEFIIEILKDMFKEYRIDTSKGHLLKNALTYSIQCFTVIPTNEFNPVFVSIMKEFILPVFDDLPSNYLDNISHLAQLFVCRLYFVERSYTELISMPQIEIFEKYKDTHPEYVAFTFSEMLNSNSLQLQYYVPFFIEKFKDFCDIDNKLPQIQSGRFLHQGRNIFCTFGCLAWDNQNASRLLEIFSTQILPIRDNFNLNTRANLVGFFYTLTLSHISVFKREHYEFILNEILPPFLLDNNDDVHRPSLSLLNSLINILYGSDMESCYSTIQKMFPPMKKDGNSKDYYLPAFYSCAMISNISIWFDRLPPWLPDLFYQLEMIFNQHICTKEISDTVSLFWKRHEGREIPELEEFRYSFSKRSYFC